MKTISRKEFVHKSCPLIIASLIGAPLLNSCSKENLDSSNEQSEELGDSSNLFGEDGYEFESSVLKIDLENHNFKSLKETNSFVNHLPQGVLVLRKSSTQVLAFDNCCPHQGAKDRWTYSASGFKCNRHGNEFGIDETSIVECNSNKVTGNLKQYPATLDGTIISIQLD